MKSRRWPTKGVSYEHDFDRESVFKEAQQVAAMGLRMMYLVQNGPVKK